MSMGPVIYKRDANGAIRVWRYETTGGKWRTHTGVKSGKAVTSEWTVCKPKSKDTAEEQAVFEADAEMRKKLERDYRPSIEEVDRPRDSVVKPMLAHKFEGWVPGWQKVYSQPKLDGIRCIATQSGLWSRQGKPIVACPHVEEALRPLFAVCPTLILDGELYNHALRNDFNAITSAVKKLKPSDDDLKMSKDRIQYHVYDMPSHDGKFSERVRELMDTIPFAHEHLYVVQTYEHEDEQGLTKHYERCLGDGYEGQIVRLNGIYEQKRSKLLLKRKEFQDAEFEVVRIEEGQGNWSGYAKRAVLRLEDGREFGAGIKGDQAFTRALLTGEIPTTATVRFFALTPDGVPRFPVATAFHHGERL